MKKIKLMKVFTILTLSLAIWSSSYAQADNRFRLVYNPCGANYEVHFVAQNTFALQSGRLNVATSSVGIVLPAIAPDVTLTVTPVNGGQWADNAQRYAPAALPGSDIHYVTTTGAPVTIASVTAGTDILLFTFIIGTNPGQCFTGVRLFRNWAGTATIPCSGANLTMQWPNFAAEGTNTPDPCSGDLGGANFNNAFQSLINNNSYRGNLTNLGTACTAGFDFGDLTSLWGAPKATVISPDCNADGVPDGTNGAVWAGARVDTEAAQFFTSDGTGDNSNGSNDEDGITFPTGPIAPGFTYNYNLTLNSNQTSKTVFYGMWFDWNNDGNFNNDVDGNGNPAFYSGSGVTASPVVVPVPVKTPGAPSSAFKVRLIVSDVAVTSSAFAATILNGEIEDYQAAATILPVAFGNITAEAKNCNVYLAFDYLSQQNNKEFRVEYSVNGTNWQELATLPNTGNLGSKSYSYVHANPVAGANYYRIKQVDVNGSFSYSKTVSTNSTCEGRIRIVSYPNPVHATLTVVLPLNLGKSQLRVMDAAGKMISNITTQNQFNTINTGMLASGLYLLEVVNGNKIVYSTKFVKE